MQSESQSNIQPQTPDLFLDAGEGGYIKQFEKKFESKDVEYNIEYSVNERGEVKYVRISKTIYPLKCCLNNVKKVIEISEGKVEPYRIEVYVVRNEWNGSGRDDIFMIEFNDYGAESPPFLTIDTIESIKSIQQLKRYIKYTLTYIKLICTMSIDSFME